MGLKRYKNHSRNYIKHENQPNENKIERISLVALNFSSERISVDFSSVTSSKIGKKTKKNQKCNPNCKESFLAKSFLKYPKILGLT